ncbi:tdk [Ecytonucleospora hepatopenaei]|uniref:Thymidine kinase n=1 Tax=Ecytonucleospora hepatopenaei TaxID=646526 RepID=A0A1W0E7R0_9MICR|nr:tdk [Ecytonucleospora hepatopenaei]
MSTFKFIFGPVSCGKTIELVKQAHQITKIHGKGAVKLMKPDFDTRYGAESIKSACGLTMKADYIVGKKDNILDLEIEPEIYLLVDEVQFMTVDQMIQLRKLSLEKNIAVECYGLLKDFRNDMFHASAKLLELVDNMKLVKTFCYFCSKNKLPTKQANATCSMKIIKDENGNIFPTTEGEKCQCGGIETYVPTCSKCFMMAFKEVEMTPFVLSQYEQ